MRHPTHPKPLFGETSLHLCVKHAKEKTIDDVLSPAGWRKIVEAMMKQRLVVPLKELTTLEWRNLH